MNRKVEVIAYHGWGMNAEFWNNWDPLFGEHVTFKKYDRGYFSEPVNPKFEEDDAIRVLFVQGFGMHLVPVEQWRQADLIVLFSAFNNLKDIMLPSRQLDHVVTQLQAQIKSKVYKTIELFWGEMFKSDDPVVNIDQFDVRDKSLLINDLNAYYQDLVKKAPIQKNAKVMLYETQYDDIATHTQAVEMKKLFGRLNYHHTFEFVGHAYPFTHAKECYEDINSHINVF